MRTLVVVLQLAIFCAASSIPDPTVEISDGPVRGKAEFSRLGKAYLAFKGIPYAKPPVKELRFKVNAFICSCIL